MFRGIVNEQNVSEIKRELILRIKSSYVLSTNCQKRKSSDFRFGVREDQTFQRGLFGRQSGHSKGTIH